MQRALTTSHARSATSPSANRKIARDLALFHVASRWQDPVAEDDARMATDDMKDRLERVETKLTHVETKLDQLSTRVDALPTRDDMTAFATDIKDQLGIMVTDCKDSVQKAAEGYGATLRKIEDELRDLNDKVDTKFSDHVKILANHHERISALEGVEPR